MVHGHEGGMGIWIEITVHLSKVDGPRIPPPPADPDGIGGMTALCIFFSSEEKDHRDCGGDALIC